MRFQLQIIFVTLLLLFVSGAIIYTEMNAVNGTYSGIVQRVEPGIVRVKSGGIQQYGKTIDRNVIIVQIDERTFVFTGGQYEEKKQVLLDKLKIGDSVTVAYRQVDWNDIIFEVNKSGVSLLKRAEYDQKWSFLLYVFPCLSLALLFCYFWTKKMRKEFLQKRS